MCEKKQKTQPISILGSQGVIVDWGVMASPCAMAVVPHDDDDDHPDFHAFAAAFAGTKKFHEAAGIKIKTKCLA